MKDLSHSTLHLYVLRGRFYFILYPGMRIWGDANRFWGNLVALSVWPGTYKNRKDWTLIVWHVAIAVGTNL